jgi:hypothetical protein
VDKEGVLSSAGAVCFEYMEHIFNLWHKDFSSRFENPLGEISCRRRRRMTGANSPPKKKKGEHCGNRNILHFSKEQ